MQRSHQEQIVEQFTQQAISFARLPGHLDALELLLKMAQPGESDTVLDVACGPGLVACAFAPYAGQVTGIDITPAMIEQAQKRQQEQGLANLDWLVGDALPLPWADNSFSLVITRYSFHHFLEPQAVLAEMIRVCCPRPGAGGGCGHGPGKGGGLRPDGADARPFPHPCPDQGGVCGAVRQVWPDRLQTGGIRRGAGTGGAACRLLPGAK